MIHEKRFAHSTLKSMNKNRLIELIDLYLDHNDGLHEEIDRQYEYCQLLLKENDRLENEVRKYKAHNIELMNYIAQIEREFKNNPPLKFDELHENMWVWDNRDKKYVQVYKKRIYEYDVGCFCRGQKLLRIYSAGGWYDTEFIENRFYRREVIGDEH